MKVVKPSFRDGFSLVETMIVLAIAAILATLSFGYLIAAKPHAELEEAELRLTACTAKARNLAISKELAVRLVFDFEAQQFAMESLNRDTNTWEEAGSATGLPESVSIPSGGLTFPGGTTIQFTPRGTLVAGGSITLQSSNGESTTLQGNLVTGRFTPQGGNLR